MWTGRTPAGIPMVPDELTEAAFYGREDVATLLDEGKVPLGLDLETVEPVTWDPDLSNLLYLTSKESQMTNLLKQLIQYGQKHQEKLVVFAPEHNFLPKIENIEILSSKEDVMDMIGGLSLKVSERLDKRLTDHVVKIIILDFAHFVDGLDSVTQQKLISVLEKGYRVGYSSVIMSDSGISSRYDPVTKEAKKISQVLLGLRYTDQTIVTAVNKPMREGTLASQENYYIRQNNLTKIKVTFD